MGTKARREMTVEEFDAWANARKNVAKTLEVCDEEGGPTVSLVPKPTSVPLDFVPDDVTVPAVIEPGVGPFNAEPSRKTGGWSSESAAIRRSRRSRLFQ